MLRKKNLNKKQYNYKILTLKKPDMDTIEKLKLQKLISMLTISIGIVLLIYMINVESEPGAIPLLLIVLGAGWYGITRVRISRIKRNAPME